MGIYIPARASSSGGDCFVGVIKLAAFRRALAVGSELCIQAFMKNDFLSRKALVTPAAPAALLAPM